MTKQNQREWPSFGDILTELNSLGQLSATFADGKLAEHLSAEGSAGMDARTDITVTESNWAMETAARIKNSSSVAPSADPASAADSIDLPDQLPPAELDTSVLESSPAPEARGLFADSELDTSALEPLSPFEPLDAATSPEIPLSDGADVDAEDDTDSMTDVEFDAGPSSGEGGPTLFDQDVFGDTGPIESPTESTLESDVPPAKSTSTFGGLGTPGDQDTALISPFDAPEEDDGVQPATGMFGSGVDPITGEIDWSETEWADEESGADPQGGAHSPVGNAVTDEGDLRGGIIFAFTPTAPVGETSDIPTADAVGTDFIGAQGPSEAEDSAGFDSVATADAIENDLHDLFELDQVQEDNDNVVPLHPSSDDQSDAVVGLDTVFEADADHEPLQEWVGIDPSDIGPKDPWAHMRPAEDESKSGFWSNRPKFFGGDERKKKKKARQEAGGVEATDELGGAPAGSPVGESAHPCPACHEAGTVDLDDPVAGKVHLSCKNCGQVWSQDSPGGQDQRSA